MHQTIYIDVLISINLFINYLTLTATSKFIYLKTSKKRIILGAFLGAIYSLYILLPYKNIFFSLIIKLIMSITIVLVAFGWNDKKIFAKCTACFYIINFAFSGCILTFWFMYRPSGLVINNGMVYFNISPVIFIIIVILSYTLIDVVNKFIGKHENVSLYKKIYIKISDKIVKLNAKIDTGNNLKEPFSRLPVIVVNEEKVNKLIPKISSIFDNQNLSYNYNGYARGKIRVVPFRTISGDGILPAFKPDYVKICDNDNFSMRKEVYIAICRKELMDSKYDALINPDILL